jgi:hypothetical protein
VALGSRTSRAEALFARTGRPPLCYGVRNVSEVERVTEESEAKGSIRRNYLFIGPSVPPCRARA